MYQKNGKKKIVVDYSWINDRFSGGGLKSCQNIHEMILSKNFLKDLDIEFIINKGQKKLFNLKKFKFSFFPKNKILNHIYRFFFIFSFKNSNSIDILFIPNIYSPFFKKKIKVVNLIHDGQWLVYSKYFTIIKKLWLRFNYSLISLKKNKCIFTTNFVLNQYKSILKKNKKVVIPIPFKKYNGRLNEVRYLKYKKFNFILSSNLPHKNIEIIKNVHKNRDMQYSDIYLVIAGVGQYFNHNKKDKILNLGLVSEKQKYWLLKHCNKFLIPSLYEGYGMIMIEAMNFSKYIISSNRASLCEVGNDSVNYNKYPESYKSWYNLIFELKNKKSKIFDFSKNQKKIYNKYLKVFLEK